MSFLRPHAIPGAVQSSLLWFQLAFAVWQFIRTAKFFRLFYVLGSSLWHGLDSWIKKRKLILMRDELEVDKDAVVNLEALRSPPPGMTANDIDDYNVEVSFPGLRPSYTCLTTRHRAYHMLMLHSSRKSDPRLQFARDDDLLLPTIHLIRRLSFEDAMDHVLSGKGYDTLPQTICFFDYSSQELLNQNFLRFASIWPLILQARNFKFWSVILSIVIILMDLLSYPANKLWGFVQYWVSRLVKWIILRVSNKERRVFCYTFMATISTRFECRNFVTAKASSKVVKEVLLATHTKFDKRKVAKLSPTPISVDMQEMAGHPRSAATSREVPFSVNGKVATSNPFPTSDDMLQELAEHPRRAASPQEVPPAMNGKVTESNPSRTSDAVEEIAEHPRPAAESRDVPLSMNDEMVETNPSPTSDVVEEIAEHPRPAAGSQEGPLAMKDEVAESNGMMSISVERRADSQPTATAVKVPFLINGVEHVATVTPALTDGRSSSVHFRKHNIKVKDWTRADMAYFLQVCDYCNRLHVSPVKELDGHDAVCCSFAEIVHGVKSRNFVICEFTTPHPTLFFT